MKFNAVKGVEYQGSIYDARPTFESYGVSHGDRAGLLLKLSFILNALLINLTQMLIPFKFLCFTLGLLCLKESYNFLKFENELS